MNSRVVLRVVVALALAASRWRCSASGAGRGRGRHSAPRRRDPVTAFTPRGRAPRSVVVIAHGFAGLAAADAALCADALARRGYLALTFDFPGHGRNAVPMAGGLVDFAASTQALLRRSAGRDRGAAPGPAATAGSRCSATDGLGHRDPSGDGRPGGARHRRAVGLFTGGDGELAAQPAGRRRRARAADAARRVCGSCRSRSAGRRRKWVAPMATRRGMARRFALAEGVEHISVLAARRRSARRSTGSTAASAHRRSRRGRPTSTRGGWLALLYLGLVALAWPLSALLPRALVKIARRHRCRRARGSARSGHRPAS